MKGRDMRATWHFIPQPVYLKDGQRVEWLNESNAAFFVS
ncbi:hypothetical protein B4099_1505 [Heyndrickxia coagulans]|uniref:Uncharacterized protein n=1 Tax=Heyndrickxia coagulans TaxID=1398 RepID=A0A150K899_HEYCO|nr:hypothetical protein B4099_1505 [Heyndrickxia coagulans]